MAMKVYILGSGAAMPTVGRGVSSVAVQIDRDWLLVDCGEGTQVQMQRFRIKWGRIDHILISHLHGDHFFGLPGLIFTYHLFNRQRPLNIYSHEGLQAIIENLLQTTIPNLSYPIVFHPVQSGVSYEIIKNKHFVVNTLPLIHRIQSNGFLIKTVPGDRRIDHEFISNYQPDRKLLRAIQQGADWEDGNGIYLENEKITLPGRKPASFAYVSDSSFSLDVAENIRNVDLLYHEATFSAGEEALAMAKGHSTSQQAGIVAREASARQLILGHLSTRTKSLSAFLNQAIKEFPNTELAVDGQVYDLMT